MRLRTTRGVKKRYVEEHTVFDDDDDDEPIVVPEDQSKDDGDFEAPSEDAPQADEEDDDDDNVDDAEPTSDEEDAPDHGGADGGAGEAKDHSSRPSKRQRNPGAGMIQSRKNFHDIPHYPLETRIVTRVYAGPLRRYARYSALRDTMYGPEYDRIKVIWDLETRWADFPVLPPRMPPSDHQGIIRSPWLPRAFEVIQEKRVFSWCQDHRIGSPFAQQPQQLPPPLGQELVPTAEGDIITLVGPWDKQKEVRLSQGNSFSVSPSGLPVDDPDCSDRTPSGWTFDVGGIPLAISWAPTLHSVQVLAVATVPFSDQKPASKDGPKVEEAEQTTGCIQLWGFLPHRRPGELAFPSAEPPRLLGTKCFDWGRPKRLEFCPVPMDVYGLHGMLAVLSGDGKARVIDVKNNLAGQKGQEAQDTPCYGALRTLPVDVRR
jgi:transcription factor C subunit 6